MILPNCECGCGEKVCVYRKGYRRFIKGHQCRGIKHSEETKKKISKAHLGKVYSKETKKRMSRGSMGIKPTDETKLKMLKAHKGIKFSEGHKKNLSIMRKGIKFTDEHRLNIAISHMKSRTDGYCDAWSDPEYVDDCRKGACEQCGLTNMLHIQMFGCQLYAHHLNGKKECAPEDIQTLCCSCHSKLHVKGRKHSAEAIKNMSKSQKGHKVSTETRKKLSKSLKAYWEKKNDTITNDKAAKL